MLPSTFDNRRGFYTSHSDHRDTRLMVSLAVIIFTQQSMSPLFQEGGASHSCSHHIEHLSTFAWMKESLSSADEGRGHALAKPLTDAFTKSSNLKQVLISLLGATAVGVVWYTGSSTRSSICRRFSNSIRGQRTSSLLSPCSGRCLSSPSLNLSLNVLDIRNS